MRRYILFLLLIAGLFSCKKGDLLKGIYNGDLAVEVAALPNTPMLDLYFDGEFVGVIGPGTPQKHVLPADKEGLIEIRQHEGTEVVLDTTVMIPREKSLLLRMAYSEQFNLKTFLKPADIPQDKFQMQIYNNLPESAIPLDRIIEAELYYETPFNSANWEPVGLPVIPVFERFKLVPGVMTLPAFHADGNEINYMLVCRDAGTKEMITDKFGRNGAATSFGYYNGKLLVWSIGYSPRSTYQNTVIEL